MAAPAESTVQFPLSPGSSPAAATPGATAIRIRGLGKFVDVPVVMDGAGRPREAWRSLLRIAGFNLPNVENEEIARTVTTRGQVLRDVSLDIERGSVVCLVGSPDSATALLRILAGVLNPTSGRIEMRGETTSLLGGEKVDTRRTAVEHIRGSRRVAGLPKRRVDAFVSEVIDFGELQGFEHAPLRTYSTGMVLRLSAALALCGAPDIVLIDDVLGVGDVGFQRKCVDRVSELKAAGCTLVCAFSDEWLVRHAATRVVTFRDGQIAEDCSGAEWVVNASRGEGGSLVWDVQSTLPEDDLIALRALRPELQSGHETDLRLTLTFEAKAAGLRCRPSIFLMRGKTVVFRSLFDRFLDLTRPGPVNFVVRVPTEFLPKGTYGIGVSTVVVVNGAARSLKAMDAVRLMVHREGGVDAAGDVPAITPSLPWHLERLAESGG